VCARVCVRLRGRVETDCSLYSSKRSGREITALSFWFAAFDLQYIFYSKNEEKIALRFLLWENHPLKTRDFFCQHQKLLDFDRKPKKIL
jgi:hypothetical protein